MRMPQKNSDEGILKKIRDLSRKRGEQLLKKNTSRLDGRKKTQVAAGKTWRFKGKWRRGGDVRPPTYEHHVEFCAARPSSRRSLAAAASAADGRRCPPVEGGGTRGEVVEG